MKIKTGWLYFFVFLLIIAANGIFYWGFQHNYFFSDDFHWLGRAVLVQDAPGEIFKIEGRDFNPVYLLLLGILIKIFGLSPLVLRLMSLLTFSAVIWMFFYLLCRYFKVNIIIALSAALLSSFNVFVSEVVLNLAALVYSLSILLFLVALKFYFDQKRWLYTVFLFFAFLTKETIILAALPLFFYEKEKNLRWFIVASTGGIILFRVLLQLAAITTSYTGFLSFDNFFYKLYFIILRTMNLSPYSIGLPMGIFVIIMLVLISVYFINKGAGDPNLFTVSRMPFFRGFISKVCRKNKAKQGINKKGGGTPNLFTVSRMPFFRSLISKVCRKNKVKQGININGGSFLFFFFLLAVFSLFFSLLPKLSSRYFFYPAYGFWGIAALLTHYFYQKKKYLQYALVPLILVSLLFNYSFIKREIEDYKILGDFSRQIIGQEAVFIKNQLRTNPGSPGIVLYKRDNRQLLAVYRLITQRKNLPKLLPPFRPQSTIAGVIEPKHLIPIIFYPDKVARWQLIEETPYYFKGNIKD
ncbi:MAG: hypothetical protein PVH61_41150 [Candidatus Aminicenantes bacterium]|jgi:hypothetical protein